MPEQLRPTDPRQIGPYRLTGFLGGGGMGEVFLGKSAGGRTVAVKVIRAEFAADHEFRTRFRREVAAARQVSGLYTALVVGADTEGPTPWLATAYVRGPSLQAAVEEHGPLPARSVLALAAGLAEGLDAVHAVGLVHRDVKPSNVLLSADGPRLIDFGIAWDAQSTVLTVAGTLFGWPEFIAPEYATGQPFGPPADVFSLGAVLTYAATGRPPFPGSSLATVVGRIAHEEPELTGVPAEVRPIVAWCLAKDPAGRPTPRELLDRIGEDDLGDDWLPEPLLADVRTSPPSAAPARRQDDDRRVEPQEQTETRPPRVRPADAPTPAPRVRPADAPTPAPRVRPADAPTPAPRVRPADAPTPAPRVRPADAPTPAPRVRPADAPTPAPRVRPADTPTPTPRERSAGAPTPVPTPAPRESARPDAVAPVPGVGRRRPAVPRAALIGVPALLVVAAAGAGLWLVLGSGHPGGGPAASRSATPPSIGAAAAVASPYRFAVSGEAEHACAASTRSSGGGHPASVVFADKTKATTVRVYWADYQGGKSLFVTLKPGASGKISGDIGDVWQLDGPGGCVAAFTTTAAAGRVTVENAKT